MSNSFNSTSVEEALRRQKERMARLESRGYVLPLKMKCSITGEEVKLTSSDYIDKKIGQYGSIAEWQKNYVSRIGENILELQAKGVLTLHVGPHAKVAIAPKTETPVAPVAEVVEVKSEETPKATSKTSTKVSSKKPVAKKGKK